MSSSGKCPEPLLPPFGPLIPLEQVPEYFRVFGYATFQAMLERGTKRDVRHLALRSLVPILLHLRDDSPTVVEPLRFK
ncbi:UNVERIFIED_CONTAM: hypothetical protein K2H54_004776 [Gekko kuhli]